MKSIAIILISLSISIFAKIPDDTPLRGQASYSWLFFDVYDAKLWTKAENNLFTQPLKLELLYKRDLKGRDITEQTKKELLHADYPKQQVKKWMSTIPNIFPNVGDGDKIIAEFDPKSGITFYFNDKKRLGQITDIDFAQAFLNIWLGEKASDQEFRNKLLGIKKEF